MPECEHRTMYVCAACARVHIFDESLRKMVSTYRIGWNVGGTLLLSKLCITAESFCIS